MNVSGAFLHFPEILISLTSNEILPVSSFRLKTQQIL